MFPCIFKRYKIANFVNENSISKGAFIVYYLLIIFSCLTFSFFIFMTFNSILNAKRKL